MRSLSLLSVLLFQTILLFAQKTDLNSQVFHKKNSINLEAGGYTVIGAVYYERVLVNSSKFKTVGQIGYGLVGFPLGIHALMSFNNHHFEFGGCVTIPSNVFIDSGASNP